jgi:hypothetical protein
MPELDCNNNNLSPELYFKGALGQDTNGNCAIRLIEVGDGNAPVKSCDLANISAFDFFKKIIEIDANGNLAIRVIQGTDSGNQCLNCNNSYTTIEDLILNSLIGLADDGRPALRLIS